MSMGTVPLQDSLPGAAKVLYLDFDGETVSGTPWNSNYTDGRAINAAPANLSTATMERIWNQVSEDFRPFTVNVTTRRTVYDAASAANRMLAIITTSDGWYNGTKPWNEQAGGVAYISSFGSSSHRVCWIFSNKLSGASTLAMATSHELGHTLGLQHWGVSGKAYYEGHGSAPVSWGPLMGAPYWTYLAQWSNGDYANSRRAGGGSQDDVAIISTKLPRRGDEDANTRATARNLHPNTASDTPNYQALNGTGIITSRTDLDYFYYDAPGAGQLIVRASPFAGNAAGRGANLDVQVKLQNASGSTLATAAPLDATFGKLAFNITAAGR